MVVLAFSGQIFKIVTIFLLSFQMLVEFNSRLSKFKFSSPKLVETNIESCYFFFDFPFGPSRALGKTTSCARGKSRPCTGSFNGALTAVVPTQCARATKAYGCGAVAGLTGVIARTRAGYGAGYGTRAAKFLRSIVLLTGAISSSTRSVQVYGILADLQVGFNVGDP